VARIPVAVVAVAVIVIVVIAFIGVLDEIGRRTTQLAMPFRVAVVTEDVESHFAVAKTTALAYPPQDPTVAGALASDPLLRESMTAVSAPERVEHPKQVAVQTLPVVHLDLFGASVEGG